MAFVLSYSKAVYEAKITELEGYYAQLSTHLESMQALQKEMYNYWNDEAARKAGIILSSEIRSVRNAMDSTTDVMTLYKEAVKKFDGTNQAIQDLLDDAAYVVGSLT